MRIIFMGTSEFSATVLRELIKHNFDIVGVVTQPDKPVGRKQELMQPEVKKIALEENIKVFQMAKIREEFSEVLEVECDLIITASYGQIIPNELLDHPKVGAINVHASILPKYRGASPINAAIINGDKESGITIMYMVEEMDAGNIISQVKVPINIDDTAGTLHDKLAIEGAKLLIEVIPKMANGTNDSIKQNEDEVTFAPKMNREDGLINFEQSNIEVYNLIRGCLPWPGAFLYNEDNKKIKIHSAELPTDEIECNQGEMIELNGELVIGCKDNRAVIIKELQIEGKKIMSAINYINGYLK